MTVVVYTNSSSFVEHLNSVLDTVVSNKFELTPPHRGQSGLVVMHLSAYTEKSVSNFVKQNSDLIHRLAIADDLPDVGKMLRFTQLGVPAYCNAYMASEHYQQLVMMIESGSSWYPPGLLSQALSLAHSKVSDESKTQHVLVDLTPRQTQIAESIAAGKSNKVVAEELGISERTVKSHLTQIYEKLDVEDRIGLVLRLNSEVS